jgi:alcohol dehydrogenase
LNQGNLFTVHPIILLNISGKGREEILIDFAGMTPQSDRLLKLWKNGTYAAKAIFPQECLMPLMDLDQFKPTELAAINYLNIAYGSLLKGGMRLGQTVLVNGATGCLDSLVVLTALVMGAAKVFPVG